MIPSIIAGAKRWCVPNSSLLLQRVFQEAAWQSNILGGSLTLLRHQSKTYFSVFGQQEVRDQYCDFVLRRLRPFNVHQQVSC